MIYITLEDSIMTVITNVQGINGAAAIFYPDQMDKIAERLYAKQSNTPIVLKVDGKTFAQISVDSINSLTKQTGYLPLKLV